MTSNSDVGQGRKHVCDSCGWIGETPEAELDDRGNGLQSYCPKCDGSSHMQHFGNPLPEPGKTWQTPYGLDECPVCRTTGLFVCDKPSECLCGAILSGLSTTEIVEVPERGEKDVLISTTEEDIRHKVFDYTDGKDLGGDPRRELAYWRVNGTPQHTGPGRMILFTTGNKKVDYAAPICTVENGRIWFDFLSPVNMELPEDAPTRGFTYTETEDFLWA